MEFEHYNIHELQRAHTRSLSVANRAKDDYADGCLPKATLQECVKLVQDIAVEIKRREDGGFDVPT